MDQKAWHSQFNQQLQGLEEFHQSSGSSLSLLGYAFDQQRLTSDEYLSWAINHYQIPRLQRRFFTESAPSAAVYSKWAQHYAWSQECMPVAEWDGSLIVACLQPPENFPVNPHTIFVLCDYESLKEYWAQHSAPVEVSSVGPTPVLKETPEGIDLSLNTTTSVKSDSFSFEDLGLDDTADSHTDSEIVLSDEDSPLELATPEEPLDGLLSEQTVTRLEFKNPEAVAESADILVAEDTASDIIIETPVVEEIALAPEVLVAATVPPEEKTVVAAAAPAKPNIPPPPQKASAQTPPPFTDENSFVKKMAPTTAAIAPKIIPGGKPTVTPSTAANLSLDKWKKKYSNQMSEKITHVLAQMKNHFEKSLILTLDEKESQASVFAWDESFKDVSATSARVALDTPSIFRVVAATQKPFHGYISINEVNEKFFEEWNHGRIPDHVTISPIIVNEKLVGMLMGLGEKSAYNKMALNSTEKLSAEFANHLSGLKVA